MTDTPASRWFTDVLGGLTAMLVALPASIGFGVLAYSSLGPSYASAGAMTGLMGAAALGLVAPWIGRTAGLITAPCAPAAAVLVALITELSTAPSGAPARSPHTVLALVALTALLASLLQIAYGLLRGGSLIKFIPHPVVTGYLSGVGLIIALTQLPKIMGLPTGVSIWQGLSNPQWWQLESLLIGSVTIITMNVAVRITQRVPAAVIGLACGMATYFILSRFNVSMQQLEHNPLVVGTLQTSGSLIDGVTTRLLSLGNITPADVSLIFVHALTLSVLLSIDTLKTCIGLDAMTRHRHHSNRELIGQGIGNLASFLSGGMPGAGATGPTMVNISSGGHTWRSGVIEGLFVVLAILYLSPLIAWVPVSALAGILLMVAWRMFDRHMFLLLRFKENWTDFIVILIVTLTAVFVGMIAAAAAGIGLTILLFIRDQIGSTVIRQKLSLAQTASKTRRSELERHCLDQQGKHAVFCALQGHLFFGTTDQLFTQLEPELRHCHYILLDLRRVQSMDYTAAQLFKRMNTQLLESGGRLLFSGMPSGVDEQRNFELYLRQLGIVDDQQGVLTFDTQDSALEWMEEQLLKRQGLHEREDEIVELNEIKLFQQLDSDAWEKLKACARCILLPAGETLCSRGDSGDELFVVRQGSLAFYLPLDSGKLHHLDTAGPGSVCGEVAFLDRTVRSADVIAKTHCQLYAISRDHFDQAFHDRADIRADVYASLASLIGERLRQNSKQLQALEDR